MSIRDTHAKILEQAASKLELLATNRAIPEAVVDPALALSNQVWQESGSYIEPTARKNLRLAIVAMRGLMQSIRRDEGLNRSGVETAIAIAGEIRSVALKLRLDPRAVLAAARNPIKSEPAGSFSPIGMRLTSMRELADAKPFVVARSDLHIRKTPELSADAIPLADHLIRAAGMRSRLPVKTPVNQSFVVVDDVPVLAYPKGKIDDIALHRTAMDFVHLRGAYVRRVPGTLPAASQDPGMYLLWDQTLIGMPTDIVRNKDSIRQIVDRFCKRMGPHANPLAGGGDPYQTIRSPGNPLAWLWLVPQHALASGAMSFKSAAFPWQTEETQDARESRERQDRRELRNLMEMRDVLFKRGKLLSDSDRERLNELQEALDASKAVPKAETMPERTARLAALKLKLEEQVKKKYASTLGLIADLRSELQDMGPALTDDGSAKYKADKKRRTALKKEIDLHTKEIDEGRAKLARAMSGK